MPVSRPLAIIALLIGGAVVASAVSAVLPPEEVPASASDSAVLLSNALVYGEWIVTLTGTVAAVVLLSKRPRRAARLLAASLYTLTIGVAFVAYGVSAFGGSDAGMGPAFFGGPLTLLSAIVVVTSSGVVLRHRTEPLGRMLSAAGIGAALTIGWLLLRGPEDWQGALSVTRLHGAPIVVAVIAVSAALLVSPTPNPPAQPLA